MYWTKKSNTLINANKSFKLLKIQNLLQILLKKKLEIKNLHGSFGYGHVEPIKDLVAVLLGSVGFVCPPDADGVLSALVHCGLLGAEAAAHGGGRRGGVGVRLRRGRRREGRFGHPGRRPRPRPHRRRGPTHRRQHHLRHAALQQSTRPSATMRVHRWQQCLGVAAMERTRV